MEKIVTIDTPPKPPSPRRLAANRANARRSRGPVTPEGKARVALNAVKHGLRAKALVLTNEDKQAFLEYRTAYYAELNPQGPIEEDLVDEMISAKWRQMRLWAVETAELDYRMDRQMAELKKYKKLDEPTRLALAAREDFGSIHLMNRYEVALHRLYLRSLNTLLKLQSADAEIPLPEQPAA